MDSERMGRSAFSWSSTDNKRREQVAFIRVMAASASSISALTRSSSLLVFDRLWRRGKVSDEGEGSLEVNVFGAMGGG